MIYILVRIFLLALVVALCIFLGYRYHYRLTKSKKIASVIMICLLFAIFMEIPFENMFYTFPSIEAAWEYQYSGTISRIIEGERSSLVIYRNERNHLGYSMYMRKNSGWKFKNFFGDEYLWMDNVGGLYKDNIMLFKLRGSYESYIIINHMMSNSDTNPISIKDSYGSTYQKIDLYPPITEIATYYSIIGPSVGEYVVTIDGNSAKFILNK